SFPGIDLRVRSVESRFLRQVQTKVFHVANNADDRDPLDLRISRPANSFPEWVLILKILAHHLLVRDADEWCVVVKVLRAKISTASQRNLHDFEVVAEHAARFQTRFVAGRDWRATFDQKVVVERIAAEWKLTDHRGLHTRK